MYKIAMWNHKNDFSYMYAALVVFVLEYGVAKTKNFYRINQDYCSYRSQDYH